MTPYTLREILHIARNGNENQWLKVVDFLIGYKGPEDDLLGLKLYLEEHNYNKMLLLSFESEMRKMEPGKRKSRVAKMPAWAMVMAASIVLAGGLYINNSVQRKSLHIKEVPLPVYLSSHDLVFNKAMSLYKKADYEKASLLFRQLGSDTALYYEAVCYEMLSYFELSKTALQQVGTGSVYYNKSRIRMAAIAVDEGNNKVAQKIVNSIKPSNKNEAERIKSIKARLK
jgi:hypothetical protein